MEKSQIQYRLKTVKGLGDFAKLLNDVKKDEFKSPKYEITAKQLLHFCSDKICPNRYKTFYIRKKNGNLREINAPSYQLGIILHILNIVFKSVYTPKSSAMGFVEGRSVVSNASVHVGHNYVFNIDLENFFPSIPQSAIRKRLCQKPFKLPFVVSLIISNLCCKESEDGINKFLPQGSPTSPLLTNAVCDTLDHIMRGVANRFGVHYTRYADDMTFSSMHNVYQEDSEFRKEIRRVIESLGFKMNDEKTRLLKSGERQEVTGLTVNECVNVSRKYIRDIRCILHIWEKEGYGKAYAYFYPFYKHDKGYIKKGEPVMENVIGGKLNYLRMVKGSSNPAYCKLISRYNKLLTPIYVDKKTDKNQSYIYVHSYKIDEFEKYFNTSIGLEVSSKNKLVGKCNIFGIDKIISISKSTQSVLCKDINTLTEGSVVTSVLLPNCFITLCRAKGKNFWLITKTSMQRSECLGIVNADIDVDKILLIWERKGILAAANTFGKNLFQIKERDKESTVKTIITGNKTEGEKESHKIQSEVDSFPQITIDDEDGIFLDSCILEDI